VSSCPVADITSLPWMILEADAERASKTRRKYV
jgi:hypothetical protein